jgi:hypothetical protein
MPNPNTPLGLVPVKYRNGQQYNGQVNVYFIPATDATALFIGDPVKGVTNQADANGIPVITKATPGNTLIGVVVDFVSHAGITRLQSDPVQRSANTAAYALVADDPELFFEVQENDSGGAMPLGAGGRNVEWAAGAGGNTSTGKSSAVLASNTLAVTNTLSLRVHRFVERPDNVPLDGTAKWLVSINLHAFRAPLGV